MKPWEVMKAHEEGAQIQMQTKHSVLWHDSVGSPMWDWRNCDYRVKPAPKPPRYEPFTQDTWPIGAWVKRNDDIMLAVRVSIRGVFLGGLGSCTFADSLRECKLLEIRDGKVISERPCGREVRDE